MSATPTEEQVQEVSTGATEEAAAEATSSTVEDGEQAFAEEDLSIPEDVPSADDPSAGPTPQS